MEHRWLDFKKVQIFFTIIVITGTIILLNYPSYANANIKHEVPYYKQERSYYCAEACIQMILDYYHVNPLPTQFEIAIEANYKENTTLVSNMPEPFKKRNMQYDVRTNKEDYNLAYKELIEVITDKPVIILITWKNGVGHYLVVYGGNYTGINYHDPLYGKNKYITRDELKYLWYDYCKNYLQPVCWMLIVNPVEQSWLVEIVVVGGTTILVILIAFEINRRSRARASL